MRIILAVAIFLMCAITPYRAYAAYISNQSESSFRITNDSNGEYLLFEGGLPPSGTLQQANFEADSPYGKGVVLPNMDGAYTIEPVGGNINMRIIFDADSRLFLSGTGISKINTTAQSVLIAGNNISYDVTMSTGGNRHMEQGYGTNPSESVRLQNSSGGKALSLTRHNNQVDIKGEDLSAAILTNNYWHPSMSTESETIDISKAGDEFTLFFYG